MIINLSPYEKDQMIPKALGQTALGRDLLAQDYILKQLTASLIYPEKNLGKEFWNRVYTKAQAMYGTSDIPVNTFNKVWILAKKATVYEHNQTAFVMEGHLNVMLDEDYIAMSHQKDMAESKATAGLNPTNQKINELGSQIVREIVLPELEKEVNTGKNFAMLRQIFYSEILATWYKKNLKEALLNQVYSDKSTVNGIHLNDPSVKDKIYQQYLNAYKKGVFNYIKEDPQANGQSIPRKYFSGGYAPQLNRAMNVVNTVGGQDEGRFQPVGNDYALKVVLGTNGLMPTTSSAAMTSERRLKLLTIMKEILGGKLPENLFSPFEQHYKAFLKEKVNPLLDVIDEVIRYKGIIPRDLKSEKAIEVLLLGVDVLREDLKDIAPYDQGIKDILKGIDDDLRSLQSMTDVHLIINTSLKECFEQVIRKFNLLEAELKNDSKIHDKENIRQLITLRKAKLRDYLNFLRSSGIGAASWFVIHRLAKYLSSNDQFLRSIDKQEAAQPSNPTEANAAMNAGKTNLALPVPESEVYIHSTLQSVPDRGSYVFKVNYRNEEAVLVINKDLAKPEKPIKGHFLGWGRDEDFIFQGNVSFYPSIIELRKMLQQIGVVKTDAAMTTNNDYERMNNDARRPNQSIEALSSLASAVEQPLKYWRVAKDMEPKWRNLLQFINKRILSLKVPESIRQLTGKMDIQTDLNNYLVYGAARERYYWSKVPIIKDKKTLDQIKALVPDSFPVENWGNLRFDGLTNEENQFVFAGITIEIGPHQYAFISLVENNDDPVYNEYYAVRGIEGLKQEIVFLGKNKDRQLVSYTTVENVKVEVNREIITLTPVAQEAPQPSNPTEANAAMNTQEEFVAATNDLQKLLTKDLRKIEEDTLLLKMFDRGVLKGAIGRKWANAINSNSTDLLNRFPSVDLRVYINYPDSVIDLVKNNPEALNELAAILWNAPHIKQYFLTKFHSQGGSQEALWLPSPAFDGKFFNVTGAIESINIVPKEQKGSRNYSGQANLNLLKPMPRRKGSTVLPADVVKDSFLSLEADDYNYTMDIPTGSSNTMVAECLLKQMADFLGGNGLEGRKITEVTRNLTYGPTIQGFKRKNNTLIGHAQWDEGVDADEDQPNDQYSTKLNVLTEENNQILITAKTIMNGLPRSAFPSLPVPIKDLKKVRFELKSPQELTVKLEGSWGDVQKRPAKVNFPGGMPVTINFELVSDQGSSKKAPNTQETKNRAMTTQERFKRAVGDVEKLLEHWEVMKTMGVPLQIDMRNRSSKLPGWIDLSQNKRSELFNNLPKSDTLVVVEFNAKPESKQMALILWNLPKILKMRSLKGNDKDMNFGNCYVSLHPRGVYVLVLPTNYPGDISPKKYKLDKPMPRTKGDFVTASRKGVKTRSRRDETREVHSSGTYTADDMGSTSRDGFGEEDSFELPDPAMMTRVSTQDLISERPLTPREIKSLTKDQIRLLPNDRIGSMSKDEVRAFSPEQIEMMYFEQVRGLAISISDKKWSLSSDQVSNLSEAYLRRVITDMREQYVEDRDRMPGDYIAPGPWDYSSTKRHAIDYLPSHKVQAVQPKDIPSLSVHQVRHVDPEDIENLFSIEKFQHFSEEQLQALDYKQLQALPKEYIEALNSTQRKAFTQPQLEALQLMGKNSAMTAEKLAPRFDRAALANVVTQKPQTNLRGGIDLTHADLAMTVTKDASGGVKVSFDPAMIARIRQEGIQSAVPVIVDVHLMPMADIRPLLGFQK